MGNKITRVVVGGSQADINFPVSPIAPFSCPFFNLSLENHFDIHHWYITIFLFLSIQCFLETLNYALFRKLTLTWGYIWLPLRFKSEVIYVQANWISRLFMQSEISSGGRILYSPQVLSPLSNNFEQARIQTLSICVFLCYLLNQSCGGCTS